MQTTIFQTDEWAQFKCQTGYADSYRIDDMLVLEKKLPLGRTMLYAPMMDKNQISKTIPPHTPPKLGGKKEEIMEKIKKLAQERKAVFLRWEFDVPSNNLTIEQLNDLRSLGFRRAFEEMQPEHTLILNIASSETDILAQMKQKGRYNIKTAEKSGLNISWSKNPGTELDDFYRLYTEMAKRQKISCRQKQYFEALLAILGQKGYARAYSAKKNSVPLAAAIVTYYNDRATYLFGGSSSEMRNLMATYGLHWQVIKDARGLACTEYDFFGIAPDDNEKHPWAGVTRFKKQFGGTEMHLAGSWDLVFRPAEYQMFKMAEKIRR